jgi:ABC-type glycerol-3-phosphate transport system substrate-binding protein
MISCGGGKSVQIWTDRPEFALYGELFNTVQTQYKVSVKYFDNPGQELEKTRNTADIIVGNWLKNASTGTYFRSLDNIFGANKLSRNIFYPRLLAAGRVERSQYLLPVSFNLPAIIFSKEKNIALKSSSTIEFDEIKTLSREFNIITQGAHTKMGFSPLWSDDFLLTAAVLSGSNFKEVSPLSWDTAALERSMDYVYSWTNEINTSIQAEENFTFKYFFEPPEKLIQNDRILFSYMNSRDFFTLNNESKSALDYRWIMEKDKVPIIEDIVFLGMPKRAKSTKAARAFIQWFFTVENQAIILEYSTANRISENIFGICGGFSALFPVTEQVFPRFYPELIGRMPPSDYLMPPNVLPGNWADIRARIILPYLYDRARVPEASQVYPLERRIADWIRMNR